MIRSAGRSRWPISPERTSPGNASSTQTWTGRGRLLVEDPNWWAMLIATFPPKLCPISISGNNFKEARSCNTSPAAESTVWGPWPWNWFADCPWHLKSTSKTCHDGYPSTNLLANDCIFLLDPKIPWIKTAVGGWRPFSMPLCEENRTNDPWIISYAILVEEVFSALVLSSWTDVFGSAIPEYARTMSLFLEWTEPPIPWVPRTEEYVEPESSSDSSSSPPLPGATTYGEGSGEAIVVEARSNWDTVGFTLIREGVCTRRACRITDSLYIFADMNPSNWAQDLGVDSDAPPRLHHVFILFAYNSNLPLNMLLLLVRSPSVSKLSSRCVDTIFWDRQFLFISYWSDCMVW